MAIEPRDPKIMCLAASGVYLTTDGAFTWTNIADERFAPYLTWTGTMDPQNASRLYVGTAKGAWTAALAK